MDPAATPTPVPEPTSTYGGTYMPHNYTSSHTLQDVRENRSVFGCFHKAGYMSP